ncbi:hypothetical protein OPV22_006477 [Ensete ventricosum]|uniref:Uncharacterized protein n=1 Tax=Ensete ventricosum TaxID=4639 RepID=A0AAV8RRU5_ENSVE|nr:hypothetical protein OPV22_006477 [Ensete ventricosum]
MPAHMLSSVEFQPLGVKNPPMAGLLRAPASKETPLIRLVQELLWQDGCLALHQIRSNDPQELIPAVGNPHANSISCWLLITVMLPKFTKTVDPGRLSANDVKHAGSSFHRLELIESSGFPGDLGKQHWQWTDGVQKTGGSMPLRLGRSFPGRECVEGRLWF